jgi:peptide/nickel transport system substrate-binding protein
VDRVIVRYVKEYTTRRQLLLRGDVDMIDAPSIEDLASLRQNPDLTVVDAPTLNMDYIVFNFRTPALADRRVRQAIAQAVDVAGALKGIMGGEGIPAAGPLAPTFPEHNKALKPLPRDLTSARQAIAQAQKEKGLKAEDLTVDYLYWTGEDRLRQLGELVKSNLAEIGVTVNLRELAWPAYQSTMFNPKTTPPLAFNSGWLVYAEPSAALRTYFHSKSSYNFGGYDNPKVDQLLVEADRTKDAEKRAQLYREIQRLIHDDIAWVPLWAMTVSTPMRKWVKGFTFNPIYMAWTSFYDLSVDR